MPALLIAALLQQAEPLSAADIGLSAAPAQVAVPKLVRRGQPVTLTVRSGALTITAQGRALADGRESDMVRVVTSASRTLEGVVEASGAVRVAAPN
jgi:flagella basal body P-ring formation protein FlgA